MVQCTLREQLHTYIRTLASERDANDDEKLLYIVRMKKQVKLCTTPLNVWGTAQEFECDPNTLENGLELCIQHFLHSGAAQRFAQRWKTISIS